MGSAGQGGQEPIGSELFKEDSSFEDIVLQFVEGLAGRLEIMERALNVSDLDALRIAAHQLKGSGGGYGYPILTEEAARLESLAKDGASEECVSVLADLKALCARVVVSPDA